MLSDPRFTRQLTADDAARITDSETGGLFNSGMASAIPQDPEGHRNWRRMITKWFTAKRMASMRPEIEAMAEQLVDEMVQSGHPADLRQSLGFPLPVWVICDMLGVPKEDRDRFSYWSDTFLNLTRYNDDEIAQAQREFTHYMAGHVAAKREAPGDDLLSELITADQLPDRAVIATGMGLLVAGHETTANMIGKLVAMLLVDRTRWERLLHDPSLVRTAVEEGLRYDANLGFGLPRYITEEVDVTDGHLTRGTTVLCDMGAANRDEKVYEDAGEMRLDRSPNPHLTFGAGPHACIGQSLARTELQAVLDVLLRRLPTLDLAVPADELRRVDGLVVGGLRELPVRW